MIGMLGWLGSGLVVASLVQHDVRRLRQVNLAACAALVIFNLALGIASMIALNIVLACVNGYHLLQARPETPQAIAPPAREAHATRSHRATVGPDERQHAIARRNVLVGRYPVRPL